MSKNIYQVYEANPITTNASTDLMYFGQSPYGLGDDAAMTFANFSSQFQSVITPAALTKVNDTNVTLTLAGNPSTALLNATSITAGWTGTLSGARGGTGVANSGLTINLGSATTGYVLTSDSSGNATWQANAESNAISTIDGDTGSVTANAGTVTISGGTTGLTTSGTSHTLSLTGTLKLANGGTNANLTASNGGIFYSTASAGAILSGTATASLPLLSGSSTTPAWGSYALSLGGALTTAGALTTSGAYASTFTMTNTTSVTFPTSGTLATTSQLPSGAALTESNDTNVTLTLGGTPSTALLQATSITAGWSGTLSLTRGGTAAALTASNGGIFYSTASAGAILAGTSTAGQLLTSGASTTPAWSTSTYPLTNAANTLLYASSANTMAALATANDGVLVTSNAGVPSWLANSGTPGYVLTANSGAPPSWQAGGGSGTVNSGTINDLAYYAASGTAVSGLATANSGVLVTSSGGVPSISSTLPAFTTSTITFSPTTGGIVGTTTNDNAASGNVGQYLSSNIAVAGATSISTASPTSLTSITLSAGDWDVGGNILAISSGTFLTTLKVGTYTTTNTFPDGSYCTFFNGTGLFAQMGLDAPIQRYSVSGNTIVYIVGQVNFGTGTATQCGNIWARRVR